MNSNTKKTVLAALMAAITAIVGRIVVIPLPGNGFLNISDAVVCLCGVVLGPVWGGIAAGLGGLLTDLLAGFAVYAPASFAIKFLMGVICSVAASKTASKSSKKQFVFGLLFGILSEIIMVGGYFLFELVLYGFQAAVVDITGNAVQGAVSVIAFMLISEILKKINIKRRLS